MRLPNIYPKVHNRQERTVLSSWVSECGKRTKQEDRYGEVTGECFVLADGVGGLPSGELASSTAVETALWAYRASKAKPYSWKDRRLLIHRIFRAAHAAVRANVHGATDSATTLLVVIVGELKVHVGHVGDTVLYLFRNQSIRLLTEPDRSTDTVVTKAIGVPKKPTEPTILVFEPEKNDILILLTDGIFDWVTPDDIIKEIMKEQTDEERLHHLVTLAVNLGSSDNMTGGIIRIQ